MLTEDQEQAKFVSWFRATYPGLLIFSIPNGGKRSIAEAVKFKATGVVRGIPDIMIPEWRLFIEMKRFKGGVLSKEQKDVIEYLKTVGYTCNVCNGFESAKQVALAYQSNLKKTLDNGYV
jgi:hypothetical protein